VTWFAFLFVKHPHIFWNARNAEQLFGQIFVLGNNWEMFFHRSEKGQNDQGEHKMRVETLAHYRYRFD